MVLLVLVVKCHFLFVDPVLLFPDHPLLARHFPHGTCRLKPTQLRTVAEGLLARSPHVRFQPTGRDQIPFLADGGETRPLDNRGRPRSDDRAKTIAAFLQARC